MKRLLFLFCLYLFIIINYAQKNYPNVQYNEELKQLFIFVERKPMVRIEASAFAFHQDMIVAQDAAVIIYLDSDSIYHPCVEFNYNPYSTELLISRRVRGLGRAPFFDSYHKLEIKTDAISWKMNSTMLEFKQMIFPNSDKSSTFISQDFFDPEVMRRNKGYNDKNPMMELWELFKVHEFQPIRLGHILTAFKISKSDVVSLLIDYTVQGFVNYDMQDETVFYKSKLAHYLNNESKRHDYDNLCWESKSHYATLNMKTFDLTIHDCDFFVLSDAHIVNVYPANERVTIQKNRELHFSGRVIGGLFDFIAKACIFDYDKFQLFMPQIDSMIMFSEDKTKTKDMYGDYPLRRVKNVIEDVSGTMFIDDPKNKSGNKTFPDYPIFESREGGKVYFDQPFILNAEYKRDVFYFQIDYFVIKNLDNFNIAETKIPGRLISGGIFPDIHEPLKLQPDNSLGFIHLTDSLGLPLYGGTAHYYHAINMSNNGLRGKGSINYLTSTLNSDSLVFYLQSVRGNVNTFSVRPQVAAVEYPEVSINQARLLFLPYKNEMCITSRKTPFTIFNESTFDGALYLSPQHLTGNGILNFKRAEMQSKLMTFKHHEVEAQDASLRIFDHKKDNLYTFTTDHYMAKINFETRWGEFVSEKPQEQRFINNGFKSNAQEFTWNPIDNNILHFTWNDPYKEFSANTTPARELVKMKRTDNLLSTTEQGRRGISFNLQALDFDFEEYTLKAQGVRFVPVGDAAIIPHNGEVNIFGKAKLQRLTNAGIIASRDNLYHELYNCSVQIENGDDFKGSGYYDYIDASNTTQTIRFDTVWYFKNTKGNASVKSEVDFTLSPHFGFSGNVELNSAQEFLTFSGGVSLLHDCDTIKPTPLRINQPIDPNNIFIEINKKSRDMNNRVATVAMASSNETGRIYTRFGSAKDQINDSEYITSSGYITYNNNEQAFQAASLEKLKNPHLQGNIISLYNKNCIAIGEGAIDMGAKLGRVDFITQGQIVNYMQADSAVMNLTVSIDFLFNDEAMKIMNEYFASNKDLKFVNPNTDKNYTQALTNILGKEIYDKFEQERRSGIMITKLPEKLNVKFLFSNLSFMWSKANAAFESQTTLPLIFSGGTTVSKEIPGRIVIEKKGSRNTLYVYFELKKVFFFFQFDNNSLSAFSSDEKFNNAITKIKAKQRGINAKDGKPAFSYKLGNRGQKTRFTRKYFEGMKE
ncbi:MAG: hypothetical protein FWF70_05755 [Bacteroidetes bacterium]|nr:hypothetical protein [Bacteroidota bacterium]MCL1968368.1 hypothetical protein [Bacteroidota bacterium]